MENNAKKERELIRDIAIILEDDFTELWFIVAEISKTYPDLNLLQIRNLTIKIISEISSKNTVNLINCYDESIISNDIELISKHISNKFEYLGKIPDIGDGIWLKI